MKNTLIAIFVALFMLYYVFFVMEYNCNKYGEYIRTGYIVPNISISCEVKNEIYKRTRR